MKVLIWTTLQLLLQQYVTGSPVSLSGEETFVEVPPFRGPTFLKEAQQLLKVCAKLFGDGSPSFHVQIYSCQKACQFLWWCFWCFSCLSLLTVTPNG